VLRCGGERTLTKHADEVALKSHLGLEEASKIIANTTELVCNEALVICPIQESKAKVVPVKLRVNSLRSRLERIMHRLYDLESGNEAEKPLNVDLDLYQMENY
jgi:hypothetical protein